MEVLSRSVASDSLRPHDCSPPDFSVHGILQARILEWIAIPFSRGSFWPRGWTQVSCILGRFFTIYAIRKPLCLWASVHVTLLRGFSVHSLSLQVFLSYCFIHLLCEDNGFKLDHRLFPNTKPVEQTKCVKINYFTSDSSQNLARVWWQNIHWEWLNEEKKKWSCFCFSSRSLRIWEIL